MQTYQPSLLQHPLHPALNAAYRADESEVVAALLKEAMLPAEMRDRVSERARALVARVRAERVRSSGIDAFMHEYQLSSTEGVVLMCLAEALLRIPDDATRDKLIRDKIGSADWERHLGQSESTFVNASTWGLMLTGRIIKIDRSAGILERLIQRSGEPLVRTAVAQAMRILGRQFVMGRNIKEATERARELEAKGYRYSYDMLGEAARTGEDAERYFEAYQAAIHAIGKVAAGRGPQPAPGISIKLSALHPRYELAHGERVIAELGAKLKALALLAKRYDINLTVDAEEADRLELSLELIEHVFRDPLLAGWEGFGLAVQAYQKRAIHVIEWLIELSRSVGRRLMVRLVKGAYWDTEIKRAQERGLDDYPLFTRKANTDVSYLACARRMLGAPDALFPQFATHNAHTVAAIVEMAGGPEAAAGKFEFQRLHGMGEALYEQIVAPNGIPCRIYAPVGSHEDLLAYLVRRLLENGANTSFVNRIVDERAPIDEIIADPVARVARLTQIPHPRIPLPEDLYGAERKNSRGLDLSDYAQLQPVLEAISALESRQWQAAPIIGGVAQPGSARTLHEPADQRRVVGTVVEASDAQVTDALARAARAFPDWDDTPVAERAEALVRAAELMEAEMATLLGILVREAGKTLNDAIAEVREAVDFCRYYAMRARYDFAPRAMPGPTGESNALQLHGRGVFVCISPWNFPLAIFTGQIAAALAAGNTVIAKPAEQTPLIGAYAVGLLHRAGVPNDALQLLPGDGRVGARLVADPRVSGVAFTGSTETAWAINRTLADKRGPIVPLIAETGGQNAMVVDSSALPEQVVADVLASSFQSAGQRCSALRLLLVQDDVADKVLKMLAGAMAELRVGDPRELATDVGPVIDAEARQMLEAHAAKMAREARLIHRVEVPAAAAQGTFVAPQAFEIASIAQLEREVFGPILHVLRYPADRLGEVLDALNATGYGLTFGIHSRIDSTVREVLERVRAGNCYVNRNMIGAVVGVQPFGGEGLSGTGPKAGGPHYLYRFAAERTVSVNTTAAGGNAALMSLGEE